MLKAFVCAGAISLSQRLGFPCIYEAFAARTFALAKNKISLAGLGCLCDVAANQAPHDVSYYCRSQCYLAGASRGHRFIANPPASSSNVPNIWYDTWCDIPGTRYACILQGTILSCWFCYFSCQVVTVQVVALLQVSFIPIHSLSCRKAFVPTVK